MNPQLALDPQSSAVVEACAGSGKTWLLVSRIMRLLLDGAQPSQILAITFTRKAAQEMQARLQLWLRELAMGDDQTVRTFLAQRGMGSVTAAQIQSARGLYASVLLAQPGITISTFHGWFLQVMQRAPLNADVMQGMSLLERPGSEQEEAWEELLEQLRKRPESAEAQYMGRLFHDCGLFNTRKLLFNFLAKRGEWWAYTEGEADGLSFALDQLRQQLDVDMELDVAEDWGSCGNAEETLLAFAHQLAANGTEAQQGKATELERAWTDSTPAERFETVWALLFTKGGEPRKLKSTKKQDEDKFGFALGGLQASLQSVRDALAKQQAYRLNEAVLHCGVALLERYQALKHQKQQMDFADLEWQLCRLLQGSEHAETMQYKLDSRYRHVLLDEFQDTNPLQWQILRAWFDAAAAVDSQPTVFVVGDPKQSIYRFRRADARLFGVAREYLREYFGAHLLQNNHTRRNAPAVLAAVNAVFSGHPQGFVDFEPHTAEHTELPGHVTVLPLALAEHHEAAEPESGIFSLRNPLTEARAEREESARREEATQFANTLQNIVREWTVGAGNEARGARYGDIMVLVRSRTHLLVYEEALRAQLIPFIGSRRGGLLDTLEAEDLQALLMFLITPFADLALAQVLRTPIFGCSDEDLILIASASDKPDSALEATPQEAVPAAAVSWWSRLQRLAAPSDALQRAIGLLRRWLAFADKLPVHDLLDRIYFEGDVLARYAAAQAPEMCAKVAANLHAFMEMALSVDAGRYPSLPRFLQELRDLRESSDDAPDEGRLGSVGNAVRIYTVHESKGLEAPIVWLLDANADSKNKEGNDILVAWPTHDRKPRHFSAYAGLDSRGKMRANWFDEDAAQQAREEMNLLYVAMTRAQQALIVSGNSRSMDKEARKTTPSWYDRIAAVAGEQPNPLCNGRSDSKGAILGVGGELGHAVIAGQNVAEGATEGRADIVAVPAVIPTGRRAVRNTAQQQRGIWLHAMMQHLAHGDVGKSELLQQTTIPAEQVNDLRQQAESLLRSPQLARFFDASQYRAASNEMAYVNAAGEVKRIDRIVEFADEVWVLDYKFGDSEEAARYNAQMREYRDAMSAVFVVKAVHCALVFADGTLREV
jgi:ATP-dependent helicase/nuclease subunit A